MAPVRDKYWIYENWRARGQQGRPAPGRLRILQRRSRPERRNEGLQRPLVGPLSRPSRGGAERARHRRRADHSWLRLKKRCGVPVDASLPLRTKEQPHETL